MKLKNLYLIIISTLLLWSCNSDDAGPVYEGDLVISTIEAYNSFDYEYVFGTLTIENLDSPDLSKLSSLKDVGGLVIRNCTMTSLNGLDNLEFINRNLILENNENLESLCCLNNVERVESLQIINHPNLTSISGLSGIETVNDTLRIRFAPQLASLDGFQSLKRVNAPFNLNEVGIENLNGLQNLNHIGSLFFYRLDNLTSAVEWNQLLEIETDLKIENCALVTEINVPNLLHVPIIFVGSNPSLLQVNFGQLTSNMESVSIGGAPDMQTLQGFENVPLMGELYLNNLESLQDLTGFSGLTVVTGNLVLNNLDALTSFHGFENVTSVAMDYNGNASEYTEFFITKMDGINSLDGLEQLQSLGQIRLENNSNLVSLSGTNLQSTVPIGCRMYIENNNSLSDYCGFTNFVNQVNINAALIVDNAYNPTITQIGSSSNCSL